MQKNWERSDASWLDMEAKMCQCYGPLKAAVATALVMAPNNLKRMETAGNRGENPFSL